MIRGWTIFFLAPLVASLGFVCAVWMWNMARTGRREARRRSLLYRCEVCGRVYEDHRRVPLSACPGCRMLNQAVTVP